MAKWNTELKDFLAAYGTTQKLAMSAEDQRMQRESHAEQMLGAQQQRMFQAERQPLEVDRLKKELEHQRLVIQKAEQILPYEIEHARLGNIKTQADIKHTEYATRLTSQNIANAAYNLEVLKEGADSRKAKQEYEAAQARASMQILPQTQAAALAKAEEEVIDTENKRKDQLGDANVFLQKQTGQVLLNELERYPEAKKLFKDPQGNWLPEDQIKRGLNDFTASRVQGIDIQKYRAKWIDKPTTAMRDAEQFQSLMEKAKAGDAKAAELATYMARSKGYGDAKSLEIQINQAYMSGQPVDAADLTMLMIYKMKDPIAMRMFGEMARDPKYMQVVQEATNNVTSLNRATAGIGAVEPNKPKLLPFEGKQYPHVTPDQYEEFARTASGGTKFVAVLPSGAKMLTELPQR